MRTAPTSFPAVEQGKQLRLQVLHCCDLLANFTGLAADQRLQIAAGADPSRVMIRFSAKLTTPRGVLELPLTQAQLRAR